MGLGEGLGFEACELEIELDHEHVLDAGVGEQLEAPLERRQQLDAVAERRPGMRVEGDDRRPPSRGEQRVENAAVAEVQPVERTDRRSPRLARSSAGERTTFTASLGRALRRRG